MTTVLLLHGIPGCARDWSAVAAELAGDFEVWAPDLVGFGTRANGARDLWADAQACALAAELPAARDLIVVGHDFGGPVALHLLPLIRARVRGLVLAATNVFPDTPLPFPLSLVRLPGMPRVLFSAPSLRMMLRGHPDPVSALGPPQQQAAIREIFTAGLRELPQRYEEVEQLLTSADVPKRVIWGDRDPFFPIAQGWRTAEAAGAPLRVVERAGHFLPHEAPDVFVDAVRNL